MLLKNDALHPAVIKTITEERDSPRFTLNMPQLLSQKYNVPLLSPFLSSSGALAAPIYAKTLLSHILLSIISKDTSPILAFFRCGALLRLCEGSFDLSGYDISECELMSYLIKLNIWFEKYHPTIS